MVYLFTQIFYVLCTCSVRASTCVCIHGCVYVLVHECVYVRAACTYVHSSMPPVRRSSQILAVPLSAEEMETRHSLNKMLPVKRFTIPAASQFLPGKWTTNGAVISPSTTGDGLLKRFQSRRRASKKLQE